MGPLVPDIISNELNFVVAILIGIAFGYILEQAGFSTSKKLVGLFYGYDFTVLRVFFTAGITAMIGVIAFAHFGILDISLIYINPTFLYSALVGGLIMGLGFVVGGFCPGTSVCAAAIGKIDAMIFVAGSFIGVWIFAEAYPLFEGLYLAENWGNITIFEILGTSQSVLAVLMTTMAVGAFIFTRWVEQKVTGKPNEDVPIAKYFYGFVSVMMIFGLTAFLLPVKKDVVMQKINDETLINSFQYNTITSDELAFRLIDNDKRVQIFDFRTAEDFNQIKLPQSVNMTFDELFTKDGGRMLNMKNNVNVFLANDELTAKKAALIASELGHNNIRILKGGLNQFKTDIINFENPQIIATRQEANTFRFRTKAKEVIPVLIEKSKNTIVVKRESKRIVGGC
ncbi:MAG: YeeE/YedE thiosulfate transporter family protein [Ignavibacteria bacterium]|nr:YeeE/YedE thiosulfate transporter family protein [Ignavibacteria bacterium]